MTPAKEHAKAEAHKLGLPEDAVHIFELVSTEILQAIVEGRIDPRAMAREEIACRGLSQQGKWVGFEAAAQDMERSR
jgi:hypothetical protein